MTTGRPHDAAKAYSYTRFSTPEQAKGDSLRRQTAMAQAWAAKHAIELDEKLKFSDQGISAYSGDNFAVGALGAFLQAVREGDVPKGSYLLVESLDRISRENAFDASYTMQSIVREGVTVVDLSDGGREYNLETLRSEPMALMVMVMVFSRANNESVQKAIRSASNFESKRKKFASGDALDKPYTRRLPAWIRWNTTTKGYELIPERADIVRQIFELTEQGWGQHRVAKWLNDTGADTWGGGGWKGKYWHRSYVRKILSNPATVGTFTPHRITRAAAGRKKVRTPLEPIHHRLPAAIDRETFTRVADILSTRGTRGRNAGRAARSIFAGVLSCQHCGGTVTRVAKGQHVYLVCSAANARAGTCKYESVPYQEAEDALRLNIRQIIEDAPRGADTSGMQQEIDRQVAAVDAAEAQVRALLSLTIADKSTAAKRQLQTAEREHEAAERALMELRERLDRMTSANVANRLRAVEQALCAESLDVVSVNRTLRQAIKTMVMKPASGALLIYWHHAEAPQEIPFHTRRFKWDREQPWEAAEETTNG
ncbi:MULTISPECIES: recombinase family protein [unclassified Bradyrhizobium]|uniref:recombinase family protein n=1 Tax=unclassified Bradyrhizobium TaxID=2631580 RepID=UPI00211E7F97|nr:MULTISPECIES: recombinase family protein [unclassified Bradyrhizobium]MDD1532001.1 site-specific recombinase, DNA invertase Pin [Bradyrhizobium sp. WBOS8]MDD1585042.1 site-specific recombinase, DNA invertase Pin [Bradyrhizobium sp. WBOS4]UUO46127.1 site-specific recombinase, DNA invertase Pin [Bradyrhizobium sp. WBOS04]UUO60089.1 site-specific recombinase, DNA invertase Pin [Bradyrhizobium sp. WBOS08]